MSLNPQSHPMAMWLASQTTVHIKLAGQQWCCLLIDLSGQFAYLLYASRTGLTRFEIDVAQGRRSHPKEVLSGIVPTALAFTVVIHSFSQEPQ